jgi:riboflavin biosynthesis pyrimidine reductase
MEIFGVVQNGVVVLDASVSLPEGVNVVVTDRTTPVIRVAKNQKRVEFPLFPSSEPGTFDLTSERIAEILDDEEIEAT